VNRDRKRKLDVLAVPAIYTKKQARKIVHAAFKAGLINVYHAQPTISAGKILGCTL